MLDTFFLVIFRSVQRHLDFSVSHIDSFLPQKDRLLPYGGFTSTSDVSVRNDGPGEKLPLW